MADSKLKIWITDHYDGVGFKKLTTNLGKVKTSITKAFNSKPVRLFKVAVLAVSAAFVGTVVEAAKFNVQMAKVWTMAGGGIKNFKELREQARGLASDFGLARSEIATGMYNALSAGIDKANLEGFMTQAAKVAVADGSDISTAVDGITTVLNAFKVKADETESVTDDLFQTVRQGKTTFGDLAANLATVAPIAAASEIPLKQILAHVATLTSQGTPTAQAMTQIRASIMGLNKALGDGWSAEMSYQDGLKAVWEQAGQSQTELLKLVGSSEAVQAVLGGVGINAQMSADKLVAMADSAGAAQEAFEKVDQFRHWPTLLETARGTLSKFGEEVDQRLHPYVEKVTKKIREWRDDPVVWSGITKFLDNAVAQIDAIVSQIESVEDLGLLGEAIGEWLRDKLLEGGQKAAAFLAEKAPLIGNAIGEAAKKAIMPGFDKLADGIGARVALLAKGQLPTSDRVEELQSMRQNQQLSDAGKQASAQIEISEASQQGIADRFEAKLAARASENSSGESDSARLIDALEKGLPGQEIDELVSTLDMMDEDWDRLAEYNEQFQESTQSATESAGKSAEAAKKTAEEAAKASAANVDAHIKVQDSMRLTTEAALKTAQVADTSQQQIGQAIALMQQLAAQQSDINFRLGQTESQIVSMRS